MGCPHSVSQNPDDWVAVDTIMQKFTKGKKLAQEQDCIKALAEDCEAFQTTLDDGDIQVLTICETKGTSKQVMGKKILVCIAEIRC